MIEPAFLTTIPGSEGKLAPTVFLVRTGFHSDCTLGKLYARGKTFRTLEPPWKNNRPNISCIPPGFYPASFLARSSSGKYRGVFHIKDVPERSGILIHAGNTADHTKGCLILGKRHGTLAGKPAVLNSRTALEEFRSTTHRNPFNLLILGGTQC